MADQPLASAGVVAPTTGPSASDPTTAAGAVSSNVNLAEASTSSSINTMADLRQKAPKIYKFMMLSIAQNMCTQMSHDNDRLIEELKKMREDHSS